MTDVLITEIPPEGATQLPMLYARTSTGAIQVWMIQILGDKYRTISGQSDGKKVWSEWKEAKPKNIGRANATSGAQQAASEAQSKWQKKVDGGYKTNPDDIDDVGFTEPMLAKNWSDHGADVEFPVACQPKLDGVRCIARKDGLWSRNGKKFHPWPHILSALAPFFEKHSGAILDGEFYNHEFKNDFNEIVSLVKKSKPSEQDVAKVAEKLQYHVYDYPSLALPFRERSSALARDLAGVMTDDLARCIVLVHTDIADDEAALDLIEGEYLRDGYEGQMIRLLDSPYEFKRSKNLLKRKRFSEGEFVILAVTEGEGNKTGWAASMSFKMPDGSDFNSNVKGPEVHLRKLWTDRASLIGKQATVRYFNLTPDGVPRFPYVVGIRDYE